MRRYHAILLFGALAFTGCDSPTEAPAFTLELAKDAVTVWQGQNASINLSVTRSRLDAPIVLSVEGATEGVSAWFMMDRIEEGASGTTLEVYVSPAAAPVTTTLTVVATAEGAAQRTAQLAVTVNVTGDFALRTATPVIRLAQGGSAVVTAFVERVGGFAGTVALSHSALPAGVTGALSSTSPEVLLTAAASAPVGSYSVTLTGATAGLSSRTAAATIEVIAPQPTAPMTFEFCPPFIPVWFGYQNDGFGWQQLTSASSTYVVDATERVGLAWVFSEGPYVEIFIMYIARSENPPVARPVPCRGTKELSGSTAGLASDQIASAAMTSSLRWTNPTLPGFTLAGVGNGPVDLVSALGLPGGPGGGFDGFSASRLIVRRSVDQPDKSVLPVLDFSAAEAFDVTPVNLTLTNTDGNVVDVWHDLLTAGGTIARLHRTAASSFPISLQAVPGDRMDAADLQMLMAERYASSFALRGVAAYARAPADRTLAFGPPVAPAFATSIASEPYVRGLGRVGRQGEYSGAVRFIFGGLRGGARNVHVLVSPQFLGGAPSTWYAVVPDLSLVPGFQTGWMPAPGQAPYYQVDAYSGTTARWGAILPLFGMPADGDVLSYAISANYLSSGLSSSAARVVGAPALRLIPPGAIQTRKSVSRPGAQRSGS